MSDVSGAASWTGRSSILSLYGRHYVSLARGWVYEGSEDRRATETTYDGAWGADGGYVAFALGSGADRRFGWMHFTNITMDTLTLNGWAYNDVAGGAIMAGQTEAATAIPGAGGLVALACGAVGLRRRRRKPATTPEKTETA